MAEAAKKDQKYSWQGTDRKGQKIKGQTIASSEAAVKAHLRKQGVTPIRVNKVLFEINTAKKIEAGDIAILSRQMTTMMQAGVPLVQSMEIIGRGHENPAMGELVGEIKNDIEGGISLAEALAKHPLYFDDLFVNLVDAGEKSGALEDLLDKIATYKEKTEAIKKKVKKALTYPTAVMVIAIVVTGILLYFVVPQFQTLFQGFGADLPGFTLMVIGMSDFLQAYWWAVIGGIIITGVSFTFAHKRSLKFRRIIDKIMLRIPIVGEILNKSAVARFARTLATMFAAGVPLVEALDSVGKAAGSYTYEDAVASIKEQVSSGNQLQLAMEQTNLFPNMAIQMIAIGEESGSLDGMCIKVADFYEEEVDNMVDSLSSLLEPMIMAILGVLVGGLVVAMYLPIFKLGTVI